MKRIDMDIGSVDIVRKACDEADKLATESKSRWIAFSIRAFLVRGDKLECGALLSIGRKCETFFLKYLAQDEYGENADYQDFQEREARNFLRALDLPAKSFCMHYNPVLIIDGTPAYSSIVTLLVNGDVLTCLKGPRKEDMVWSWDQQIRYAIWHSYKIGPGDVAESAVPIRRLIKIGKICFYSEMRPYLSDRNGPLRICLPFYEPDAKDGDVFRHWTGFTDGG